MEEGNGAYCFLLGALPAIFTQYFSLYLITFIMVIPNYKGDCDMWFLSHLTMY